MKKLILLFLVVIIVFALFGCAKTEKHQDDTSISTNDLTTVKQDVESTDKLQSDMTSVSDEKSEVITSTSKEMQKEEDNTWSTTKNSFDSTSDETVKEPTTTSQTETTIAKKDENIFTVIFKDYNGNVLKEQRVKKGEDATAPEPPKRDGYVFVKWDTYYKEVKTDIDVTAIYEELTEPTLIVDTVKATGKDVVVKVSVVNNPGLLALVLKVNYDEEVMFLKNVDSGSSMGDYTFTAPKNKKSGCNAAWNIIDVPENIVDGEIAVLHFEIADDANPGAYDVSVSCYDGAFDSNYEPVKFGILNGSVNII